MRTLMILSLAATLACSGSRTEQGVNSTSDGLGEAGTDGTDGKEGEDGAPGADGADGEAGADSADGADGLHCWDLDGNGEAGVEEDTNGDGAVDVLDCRGEDGEDGADGADGADGEDGEDGATGSGSGWSKADLYTVTGTAGAVSTASCDDEDDILLHGGCSTHHNCIPATLTSRPEGADDPDVVSSWYCTDSCPSSSATAVATCISVDGP